MHLPDKMVTINATLEPEEEKELLEFLRKNQDVFAWSSSDLRGVSRDIIEHRLDINPNIKPKKQKLRKMADEKVAAVKAEVQRLLDANVIREVKYPTWLANTVPVKKKNGKWRMCIDFTDLNNGARRPKSSPARSRCCEIEPASRGIPPRLLLEIGTSDRLPKVNPSSEMLLNSFAGL